MSDIQALEGRRDAILTEIRSLRSMKRGSITEQYLNVHHKNKKEPVRRGPYYVFSRQEGNRTVSKRLSKGPDLEGARKGVAEYKRFTVLCREFVEVTEQLNLLQGSDCDQGEKKRLKSKSKKIKKSNASSKRSPNPKRST